MPTLGDSVNDQNETGPVDPTPAQPLDNETQLRHILAALEKHNRRGMIELGLAIILSLATFASTWCGYQANLWGDEASSQQGAADTAERDAIEDTIIGLQLRTFDEVAIDSYFAALRGGDTEEGKG